VILIIVIIAGPKKMGTLFEQTGGKVDEFFIWLGLRDDDDPIERCYIEKVSKFINGPEILDYFKFDNDNTEVKVCKTWCRANLGGSKDMDGTYLIDRDENGINFSIWRSDLPEKDRKYYRLDYKTLGEAEEVERNIYLAMVEKVKNLEVTYSEGDTETDYVGWLGHAGVGSMVGEKWATWYWGAEEDDDYCLWEYVHKTDKWEHWPCGNTVIKEGGTRHETYNALKGALYFNRLTFIEKKVYYLNLERPPIKIGRPMVTTEIGGKKYGVVSESQETKDFNGNAITASYTFYKFEGKAWKRFDIDKEYYLYVPESYVDGMKDYAKIRDDLLMENCGRII